MAGALLWYAVVDLSYEHVVAPVLLRTGWPDVVVAHPWLASYDWRLWQALAALAVLALLGGPRWTARGGLVLVDAGRSLREAARVLAVAAPAVALLYVLLHAVGIRYLPAVTMQPGAVVAYVALQVVVVPVVTEVWFRGAIHRLLRRGGWTGPVRLGGARITWAALLAAGLEALTHVPLRLAPSHPGLLGEARIWIGAALALVLGVVYGWLRERTGDVWASALAHGALTGVAAVTITLLAR